MRAFVWGGRPWVAVWLASAVATVACTDKRDAEHRRDPDHESARVESSTVGDAAPGPAQRDLDAERFANLGAAVAAILERESPRLVGFGEVHQQNETQGTRSALARFTESVVPVLAAHGASNMILETWAERPECGKAQAQVDRQVRRDTERPPEVQSELGQLLARTDALGIGRHAMAMSCDEYKGLLDDAGKVDYARLLSLITHKLGSKAVEVLGRAPAKSLVFLYGGALHNDRFPNPGVRQWSYAAEVEGAAADRYVEVDLLVPELIASDAVLAKESWYPLSRSKDLDDGVLLIRRGPRSYLILARRGVASAPVKKPTPRTR